MADALLSLFPDQAAVAYQGNAGGGAAHAMHQQQHPAADVSTGEASRPQSSRGGSGFPCESEDPENPEDGGDDGVDGEWEESDADYMESAEYRRMKREEEWDDRAAPPLAAGRAKRGPGRPPGTGSYAGGGNGGNGRAAASPVGLGGLRRDSLPAEVIAAEVGVVQGMWEMAAIFDFFTLFRKQIRLQRQFAAEELERVLVTSAGDGGLLAEVHIDLMRGISPKNDVSSTNWQVHLANKIKFHWRNLSDGSPCPFKPEKYLEAATYAELPAPQRVRALHFLCCIRADREDIQLRLFEAQRDKTDEELAAAAAEADAVAARLSRGTRAAKDEFPEPVVAIETVDSFRREPIGYDAAGAAYYYFDIVDTTGCRLYAYTEPEKAEAAAKAEAGDEDSNGEEGDTAIAAGQEGDEGEEDDEKERAAADSKMGRKRRERALRRMPLLKPSSDLPPPPPAGRWTVAASTLEELMALGQRMGLSNHPVEAELAAILLHQVVPQLTEKAEAEERRRRAAERVRSRLGVDDDAVGVGGRSRRERRTVNYAFTDYDDMLRSAIRRSQRREDSPSLGGEDGQGGFGGRRSRRGASPFVMTDQEAVAVGMRRGRSAATLQRTGSAASDLEEEMMQRAVRARSDPDLYAGTSAGERGGATTVAGSRGRVSRGPSRYRGSDFVEDFEDVEHRGGGGTDGHHDDYGGGSSKSKRRGRPPSAATLAARAASAAADEERRQAALSGILAEERQLDAQLMQQVAARQAAEAARVQHQGGGGGFVPQQASMPGAAAPDAAQNDRARQLLVMKQQQQARMQQLVLQQQQAQRLQSAQVVQSQLQGIGGGGFAASLQHALLSQQQGGNPAGAQQNLAAYQMLQQHQQHQQQRQQQQRQQQQQHQQQQHQQ